MVTSSQFVVIVKLSLFLFSLKSLDWELLELISCYWGISLSGLWWVCVCVCGRGDAGGLWWWWGFASAVGNSNFGVKARKNLALIQSRPTQHFPLATLNKVWSDVCFQCGGVAATAPLGKDSAPNSCPLPNEIEKTIKHD